MKELQRKENQDLKKIKNTERGTEVESQDSAAMSFFKTITSDKAKMTVWIIGFIILNIVAIKYLHPGFLLMFAPSVVIAYFVIRKYKRMSYIPIIEKPPDKGAKLWYADPDFFAKLDHKDEPADLEEPDTEVVDKIVEEGEDGKEVVEKKIAMKGIQHTRQGNRIIICQEFNPEEGYVHFGWVDSMSEIDWIIKKKIFARQNAIIKALMNKIGKTKSSAHSKALKEIENFIEGVSNLPKDKDPRDRIEDYENKKQKLIEEGDLNLQEG